MTEISSQDTNKNAQINSFNLSSKTKEQWLQEGITYYNAKSYEESLTACEKALQLDPRYAQAYYGKGLALSKLERYDEAREVYKNAVRFVSSQSQDYAVHAIFLFREGIRLFELKHYEEALDVYEIAIWLQRIALRINGSSTYIVLGEMLIAKGEVLFKLKRYQEVLDVYKQVRDAYMADPQAYSTKSSSLIETAQSLYEKR